MSDVMSEMRKKTDFDIIELRSAWRIALGSPICDNTRPGYFQGNVLVVYTSDSVWSHHLQYVKKELLQKLSASVPGKRIEDIRFKVGELY